jgi:cytochrome c556
MTRNRTVAWAIGAGIALSASLAVAATPTEERQTTMKAVGQLMKDGAGLAGGQYDAAKASTLMTQLAGHAKKLKALYPASSQADPKSGADPKVWTQKADFDKRLAEMGTLAAAAGKAKTQEEFRPAFGKLGATCKGCHDIYRKKKT